MQSDWLLKQQRFELYSTFRRKTFARLKSSANRKWALVLMNVSSESVAPRTGKRK